MAAPWRERDVVMPERFASGPDAKDDAYKAGYVQGVEATLIAISRLLTEEQRMRVMRWATIELKNWQIRDSKQPAPPAPYI